MYVKIGAHLAQLRKQHQLSQGQLAILLGVTPQAISKWERGKSMPTFSLLLRICEILDTTPDALFLLVHEEMQEEDR
jgi:transcriptional regulator with XRE-family HTH domain